MNRLEAGLPTHNPFLRFDNLLDWLTELRRMLRLLSLVYYKGYNPGTAKQKGFLGQVWEEGTSIHQLKSSLNSMA